MINPPIPANSNPGPADTVVNQLQYANELQLLINGYDPTITNRAPTPRNILPSGVPPKNGPLFLDHMTSSCSFNRKGSRYDVAAPMLVDNLVQK